MGAMASQITSLTIITQPCIQVQIKENIKAPRHWPLCGEFPAQRASNAEMFPFGDVIMNFHLYLEGVIDKSLHWFRQWLGAVKQQSHCLIPCQPISVTSLAPPSHTELTKADIHALQTDNLSVTFPAISTWRRHCLCPHFSQTWSGGRNLPCNWNLVSCTTLRHRGRDEMDAISQMTFSNAFYWMKMYWFRLRFHWNLSN